MSVVVYGFVEGFTNRLQDAHNRMQLQALPDTGAYLIKSLFSIVEQSKGRAYYGGHIHFAAGYKVFVLLDREWLGEFESLLPKLYWYEAEVIVTWSRGRYVWRSNYSKDEPDNRPNQIVSRSRYESASDLKEIPWAS